jgi:hypothetical protein
MIYREQREQMERLTAKPARPRRVADPQTCWNRAQHIADRFRPALQDLIGRMRQREPGELPPEISITLTADLPADGLPPWIELPTRAKPVSPWGRHRIAADGAVAEYPVLARIQLTATAVVYGPRNGGGATLEMSRNAWDFPLKSAETPEEHHETRMDGK